MLRYRDETTGEEWDHVLGGNLESAFLCAEHSLPAILRRGGGVVVNVASVQSSVTQRRVAAYSTMKSAPLGLTCSIAIDYAPSVRYVAVCPGTVDTPMFRNALGQAGDPGALPEECIAMHPPKRIVSPAKVADLILFLSSTKATFITGLSVRIDGGLGIGGSIRPA